MFFTDGSSDINYRHYIHIPDRKVAHGRITLAALFFYFLYREAIYHSYKKKSNLAEDIKVKPKQFKEKNDSYDPVYHYSIAASLQAMQDWNHPAEEIQAYIVYENSTKRKIGFVHFTEKIFNGKPVVYIAQLAVLLMFRGKSIGRQVNLSRVSNIHSL